MNKQGVVLLTDSPDKINYKQPDYQGMCDILDRIIKLYEITGDRKLVDPLLKSLSVPFCVVETDDIEKDLPTWFPKEENE